MQTQIQKLELTIAVVADHADLRDQFVDFLSGMGHIVSGFALDDNLDDYLACTTPDLMILALKLPSEEGYSLVKRVHAACRGTYIVMLSAHASVEDRVRGYVNGADIYLDKPFDLPELAAVVNNISRRISHERAHAVP